MHSDFRHKEDEITAIGKQNLRGGSQAAAGKDKILHSSRSPVRSAPVVTPFTVMQERSNALVSKVRRCCLVVQGRRKIRGVEHVAQAPRRPFTAS